MGDDVKDEPAKPSNQATLTGKAGWLKKCSGKFLGSYKDRYIHIDRTEIVVYENEDLKNCVERLDLENFDKCHELRSPFKKKYRLILIRSPKSVNKVGDIKLQAQTPEEKESWIKALSDGINRAKNKIFDEVKVDESISLEHVTRSRPKGNRGRRPPTRIHMKEVANISSDGNLRLDLDTLDNRPNGTPVLTANGDAPKEAVKSESLDNIQEEVSGEDTEPPKKVLKPPMPPSKSNKPSESQESESKSEVSTPQKKVVPPMPPSKDQKPIEKTEEKVVSDEVEEKKPPMPPSKDKKPRPASAGDAIEDNNVEEKISEAGSTPSMSGTAQDDTDGKESEPSNMTDHPPIPSSQDFKSIQVANVSDKDNSESDEDQEDKDVMENHEENIVKPLPIIVQKPQCVMWDSPSSDVEKSEQNANTSQSLEITVNLDSPVHASKPNSPTEVAKKSFTPPAPPKKKPLKSSVNLEDQMEATISLLPAKVSSSHEKLFERLSAEENNQPSVDPKEDKIITVSLSSSGTNQEPVLELDKKSIDSGQISAEESESSDQVTPSTDKLQSSFEVIDGVTSEEELEASDGMQDRSLHAAEGTSQVSSQSSSLKPSKKKFASMEDIIKYQGMPEVSDMTDLQSKVSMELKETGGLLGKITPKGSFEGEHDPEVLLATAMEKLRKAELFLEEARKFTENKSKRKSL